MMSYFAQSVWVCETHIPSRWLLSVGKRTQSRSTSPGAAPVSNLVEYRSLSGTDRLPRPIESSSRIER